MKAWADKWLVPEWRLAHRLWSVRIAIFWSLVSGLWVAWPAFQYYVTPLPFAISCMIFSLVMLGARLTHQPGLDP